jgi:hypothetical protein
LLTLQAPETHMTISVLLGTYGSPSLIGLTVVMILTGRLVPRRVLKDMEKDRDLWREAHGISEQTRRLEAEHTGQLLEAAKVSTAIMRSLPTVSPEAGEKANVVAQAES